MAFDPYDLDRDYGAPSGVITEAQYTRPDVKFCVSVFRQSQEWRWKTGRILAWIP